MPEKIRDPHSPQPVSPGRQQPGASPSHPVAKERWSDTLARRLRDLLIMGVVGPLAGMLAIVAIHFVTAMPPMTPDARAEQESARVMALLEDRPTGTASLPRNVVPFVSDTPVLPPESRPVPAPTAADFGTVRPTADARRMADWIVSRRDNATLPFIVLDKRDARLYVFQPNGQLVDDTPVLLGSSHGDDTFPGIGDVPISQVKPYQRTTAAGRFVTQPGLDADRTDVVWLDYAAALAMHRVINKVKSERRLERIASANPKVRRISWGCINIPIAFFDRNISPVFGKHPGVAYVIPETKTFAEVFEHDGGPAPVVATVNSAPMAPKDVGDR
jgi:hypothetical protein